ncbi:YfiR family protein [Plebeiibacterium marinum]|uniref:YfiR family protein n=1 Tax=Plebeiibacterium marinum TaxID=2992111 RepID=A0AAE3MH01_9BACT|nr:YfiR family protein [Plebeiobacterium marinum]MCW3807619.1 YfiR family protein [Plebeiobacterium marinum]
MKKRIALLIMVLISISSQGQQSMFKALFMFNFAKYIEWPNINNSDNFTIAIIGTDDINTELKKLSSSKKINNKSIVIKTIKHPNEAADAQIVFIPENKSGNLDQVLSFYETKPTLIITDKDGYCAKGSCINYTLQNGKLKYEISKERISNQNLKVDQKLVSLGIEIK